MNIKELHHATFLIEKLFYDDFHEEITSLDVCPENDLKFKNFFRKRNDIFRMIFVSLDFLQDYVESYLVHPDSRNCFWSKITAYFRNPWSDWDRLHEECTESEWPYFEKKLLNLFEEIYENFHQYFESAKKKRQVYVCSSLGSDILDGEYGSELEARIIFQNIGETVKVAWRRFHFRMKIKPHHNFL